MSRNIKQMRQNKKFYKRYNADFKDVVWRHLSGEDKTALCTRFRIIVEKQEQHFADRVDLLKAGIPKELIGRIEEVIVMNRLTKENLREILLHGKASPLQKYREMLALNDHEVIIEDNILDRIIDEASKTPYGARTLNTLLKTFLKKRLFETPSLQKGGKR